jgi:T-complex protein 1 subunit zeta
MSYLGAETQVTQTGYALLTNTSAILQLSSVMKSGLGPNGGTKLLISPGGEIRVIKDGSVLLQNMQLVHPAAVLVSRMAAVQEATYGDGTTSSVLLLSSLLGKALEHVQDGIHPQTLVKGILAVKGVLMEKLKEHKVALGESKEKLVAVARTALRTKFPMKRAAELASLIVDAVLSVTDNEVPDLHMLEVLKIMSLDSTAPLRRVRGLVLDHGGRHPMMPKALKNVFILCTNISFEYEKTEDNSQFYYSRTSQKKEMEAGERAHIKRRVDRVLDVMREICEENRHNPPRFMVITQKGVDPFALEMFAANGVLALRRAKRRNMERLQRLTGAVPVGSMDELKKECFGYAGQVREESLGDEKYTFIEETPFDASCTLIVQGASPYHMDYTSEAIKSGMKSVATAIKDRCVVPGGASVFHRLSKDLSTEEGEVHVQMASAIWKDALLSIGKTISRNLGYNSRETFAKANISDKRYPIVDVQSGEIVDALEAEVLDNFSVVENIISSAALIAMKVLMVDEIVKSGREMK